MNALYLVLPLALVIAAGAVAAFVWSVRAGQLDDFDTPPCRMLLDDHPASERANFAAADPANAKPASRGKST
jgi:cbb3-type cytochrome oxidase maturation protein